MVLNQPQNQASLNKKINYFPYFIVLVGYVVLYFIVMYVIGGDEVRDIIDPMNVLSVSVLMLISGFSLKLNYASILFFINLIIGVILVSLLTFTQGLIIIMIMLVAQKLLKVL